MSDVVVDSSALIHALSSHEGSAGRRSLMSLDLHAPHLIGVEVLSWLRRLSRNGRLTAIEVQRLLAHYGNLPLQRYPHEPFFRRTWQLRDSVSAYDAQYVSLAEVLHVPLITQDRRLAAAAAPFCAVIVPE